MEEYRALFDQLIQFGRSTHEYVQGKTAIREQIGNGAMSLKHTLCTQCIGNNEQVYVAIFDWLATSARAKKYNRLWIKGQHNFLNNILQQVICDWRI